MGSMRRVVAGLAWICGAWPLVAAAGPRTGESPALPDDPTAPRFGQSLPGGHGPLSVRLEAMPVLLGVRIDTEDPRLVTGHGDAARHALAYGGRLRAGGSFSEALQVGGFWSLHQAAAGRFDSNSAALRTGARDPLRLEQLGAFAELRPFARLGLGVTLLAGPSWLTLPRGFHDAITESLGFGAGGSLGYDFLVTGPLWLGAHVGASGHATAARSATQRGEGDDVETLIIDTSELSWTLSASLSALYW